MAEMMKISALVVEQKDGPFVLQELDLDGLGRPVGGAAIHDVAIGTPTSSLLVG